jgi:hypothetical protein
MELQQALKQYDEEPITHQALLQMLKDYKRPFDKISELIKQQKLIPVKRGIFVAGANLGVFQPDRFLLANHLWGPSYVSLESALSHWGLIPERVFETVSVTMKRAKRYRTPVGRFTYLHAPLPYYSFGIHHVSLTSRQHAMIASPAKALCDKIIMTPGVNLRSAKQTREFLLEDLRIERRSLQQMNIKEIETWLKDAPKQQSLLMLTKTLREL